MRLGNRCTLFIGFRFIVDWRVPQEGRQAERAQVGGIAIATEKFWSLGSAQRSGSSVILMREFGHASQNA
jgi:hypothetical protein